MPRMKFKDAAPFLGMTVHELYTLIRAGRVPAYRCGGSRGRWIVDTDLLKASIEAMMLENLRNDDIDNEMVIKKVV